MNLPTMTTNSYVIYFVLSPACRKFNSRWQKAAESDSFPPATLGKINKYPNLIIINIREHDVTDFPACHVIQSLCKSILYVFHFQRSSVCACTVETSYGLWFHDDCVPKYHCHIDKDDRRDEKQYARFVRKGNYFSLVRYATLSCLSALISRMLHNYLPTFNSRYFLTNIDAKFHFMFPIPYTLRGCCVLKIIIVLPCTLGPLFHLCSSRLFLLFNYCLLFIVINIITYSIYYEYYQLLFWRLLYQINKQLMHFRQRRVCSPR